MLFVFNTYFVYLHFIDTILNTLNMHVDKKEKVCRLFCIKIKSYGNLPAITLIAKGAGHCDRPDEVSHRGIAATKK